jgi:hypothetical protein
VQRAASELAAALATVRARCSPGVGVLHDAPGDLALVAARVRDAGAFAHEVGLAFAAAGQGGADGVFHADSAAVDGAMGAAWRPSGRVTSILPDQWRRMVWADRCDTSESFYGGHGGAIRGADGRLYPLVVPSIRRDGLVYNAEWGRSGQASLAGLFGADGGWHLVDIETGVERHRDAPSLLDRLLIGLGSTVGGPPIGSTAEQVDAVVLRPGERPRVESLRAHQPVPVDPPTAPPDDPSTALAGAAELGPMAIDLSVGALSADDGAQDAYQIVFEQNDDGRLRAIYQRVDVVPGVAGAPTILTASFIVGPDLDEDRIIARYLGPDGDVVASADPDIVVYDPPRGSVEGDR